MIYRCKTKEEEEKERQPWNIRINPDTRKMIKVLASRAGMGIGEYLETLFLLMNEKWMEGCYTDPRTGKLEEGDVLIDIEPYDSQIIHENHQAEMALEAE